MPGRLLPLVTNEIYHIYNRGINRQPTFTNKRECDRAIETIKFYRFADLPLRLSKFLLLEQKKQKETAESLAKSLVEILAFCLMPNHFHFLLRQQEDGGIATFIGKFLNSYTRYFNTVNKRDGSLFLDQFKAVRVETDEQLVHVSRYIHLNPYTGYVIKTLDELQLYRYSSFKDYIDNDETFVTTDLILGLFKDKNLYKQFVLDQADYQRRLKDIEHLALEA